MEVLGTSGSRPTWSQVGGSVVMVVLTALLVVQAGSVRSRTHSLASGTGHAAAGIDAPAVADAMTHPVRAVAGHPDVLAVGDGAYQARFTTDGFAVAPAGAATALRLSLHGAARGGQVLPLHQGVWNGHANVAERALSSVVHERVTATAGTVEWDVVVDAPPAGRGALAVTADVTGAARIDPQHDGLHIALSGHGGELDMGRLVVKDATGAVVYQALPRVHGRQLQLVVPERVLRGARYPLTLDPKVGPEHLAGDTSGAGTSGTAAAFDGTNYLVVWTYGLCGCSYNIDGAVVKPDGTPMSTTPITITNATGAQGEPDVVFYGSNYLVTWTDTRSGGSDIYGARVTKAGTVLDTMGLAVNTSAGEQTAPATAFDGTNVMITWTDGRSGTGTDIYGTRWSPSTGVLDGAGFAVSAATGDQSDSDVVYAGADYVVAWTDGRKGNDDIYSSRVRTTGEVRDTGGAAFTTDTSDQSGPALAFDGTNALVVWTDERLGGPDIYATRWSPATGLLEADAFPVTTAGGSQSGVTVAFHGSFLVAWLDQRNSADNADVYAARVTKAGEVSDPNGIPVATSSTNERGPVAVAGSSSTWLTFYGRDATGRIYDRTVAPK
ncbi:MAG: hypothetical protein JO291_13640 [Acidimicrobiia bacterium]|nr:hypothetical protein [Acidimicrobiia bacterium]